MAIKKRKRISVILPKKACAEVRESMLKEGYSLREKSKWCSEAIESFLKSPNFHDYVEMASLVEKSSQSETIYVLDELEEQLEQAIIPVRTKYPALEGVKSLIVRASIVRRLLSSLTETQSSH